MSTLGLHRHFADLVRHILVELVCRRSCLWSHNWRRDWQSHSRHVHYSTLQIHNQMQERILWSWWCNSADWLFRDIVRVWSACVSCLLIKHGGSSRTSLLVHLHHWRPAAPRNSKQVYHSLLTLSWLCSHWNGCFRFINQPRDTFRNRCSTTRYRHSVQD